MENEKGESTEGSSPSTNPPRVFDLQPRCIFCRRNAVSGLLDTEGHYWLFCADHDALMGLLREGFKIARAQA